MTTDPRDWLLLLAISPIIVIGILGTLAFGAAAWIASLTNPS